MSKNKERKRELGTHNTTADRVDNKELDEQIKLWVGKIREAEKLRTGDTPRAATDRVTQVMVTLVSLTRQELLAKGVIYEVVKRTNTLSSLETILRNMKNG